MLSSRENVISRSLPFILYMVLVGYNKEQYVFLINLNHMTILLKRGVLVALMINYGRQVYY